MAVKNPTIGILVVELGYCTNNQVQDGLANMRGTRMLGEVLIGKGYLTQYQLDWALIWQRIDRKEAGQKAGYRFAREQHAYLLSDLRDVTASIKILTAKIIDKD